MPSIYRPKDLNIAADADVRYGAHVQTDSQSAPTAADDQSAWAGRRKAQPANILLPATRRWLDSLPIEHRPGALAEQFPRIANLVAANWNNPKDCSAYIYSLLNDQRGGRRGFPRQVAQDILNLRVLYAALHPIIDWEVYADGHHQSKA